MKRVIKTINPLSTYLSLAFTLLPIFLDDLINQMLLSPTSFPPTISEQGVVALTTYRDLQPKAPWLTLKEKIFLISI